MAQNRTASPCSRAIQDGWATSRAEPRQFGRDPLGSPHGAPWSDMPSHFPSGSTCWRRMTEQQEKDVWIDIWQTFLGILDSKGRLKWDEVFEDGTFTPAKRWLAVGKTKRGKGTKIMAVADGKGLPIGLSLHPSRLANRSKLIEPTLDTILIHRIGAGCPRTKIND